VHQFVRTAGQVRAQLGAAGEFAAAEEQGADGGRKVFGGV